MGLGWLGTYRALVEGRHLAQARHCRLECEMKEADTRAIESARLAQGKKFEVGLWMADFVLITSPC